MFDHGSSARPLDPIGSRTARSCGPGARDRRGPFPADARRGRAAAAQVFLHPLAGVLSAYGMGLADIGALREQTVELPFEPEQVRERGAAAARQGNKGLSCGTICALARRPSFGGVGSVRVTAVYSRPDDERVVPREARRGRRRRSERGGEKFAPAPTRFLCGRPSARPSSPCLRRSVGLRLRTDAERFERGRVAGS